MIRSNWFWREVLRYRTLFQEAAVASGFANLLALVGSLFAMQVYDRVIPSGAYSTLWVLASGVALAIILEFTIRAARATLLDYATRRMDVALSNKVFDQLLAIRMDMRPKTIGTLASQVKDFEVVRNFLTSTTLFALADAPFALVFVIIVALIGGWVVVVPIAALIFTLIIALAVQIPMARLAALHVKETNERNGLLIEVIDGAESIKAAGAEAELSKRWLAMTEELACDGQKMRGISNYLQVGSNAIQQLSYAAMIVVGAYLVGDGKLSVGGLVACSILGGRVLGPVGQMVNLAFQWHYARNALKNLNGIMDLPRDGLADGQPVIREKIAAHLSTEGISFTYGKDIPPAIRLGAFEIRPGERVGIVGPTGSGKSTLLKVLTGLYRPSEGRVLLDGVDVAQMDVSQLRKAIGFLPQDIRLFQGSLRYNLTLGMAHIGDDEIIEVCRLTGLNTLVERHPRGLDLMLSEGGRGLSGGQLQSVALARSLLAKPRLLLLDEPTAAMDQALEAKIIHGILAKSTPDQVVVWVTHKPALIQAASRLVVIDQGRIVLDGPRDAVLSKLGAPPAAITARAEA
jgi:ATP-binding cassette subfamily C protein LapB